MDAKEIVKTLALHPVVFSDMSMQMQLGLPYLEKKKGKLCISFKPHKEMLHDDKILFFAPQYELAWVYPFNKLIHFDNLLYSSSVNVSIPVAETKIDDYAKLAPYVSDELYNECSRLLSAYEEEGTVSDVAVRRYQCAYYDTVQELGLEAVYGVSVL